MAGAEARGKVGAAIETTAPIPVPTPAPAIKTSALAPPREKGRTSTSTSNNYHEVRPEPKEDRTPWLSTPLNPSRASIRILQLQKGSGITPLKCTLEVAYLDTKPSYEVLSYVWGSATDTRPILVCGVPFAVTKNLFDFLHCLRSSDRDRSIWADAICIDQKNNDEKSHQITLMTKIYRDAAEAHIWFGPFHAKTWQLEMVGAKKHILATEFSPAMWAEHEKIFNKDLQYFARQEGFKPLSEKDYQAFEKRFEDDMFGETLRVLDMMAQGGHLYTYPVYTVSDTRGPKGGKMYAMIRTWPWLMDCIRWMLLRPWWTRVWTLQEAVLPRVDPLVHAPPHSFRLSRLLNGVSSMFKHNGASCCKWFGRIVVTQYRDFDDEESQWTQCLATHAQREELAELTQQRHEDWGVPLDLVVDAIQGRNATEIRDHWNGIFGLLPREWQEEYKLFPADCSTAALFNQCTKLLYSSGQELTKLVLARRTKESKVDGLPSWAIDLSAQHWGAETEYSHWKLYNAAPDTTFEFITEWPELRASELFVKARYIGKVHVCGAPVPIMEPSPAYRSSIFKTVKEWYKLFGDNSPNSNNDAFWRTVFMDRNVQIHWMHKRIRPIGQPRLQDIKTWWSAWTRTGDYHDPTMDRKSGGVFHGTYHYRALELNIEKATFFVTAAGEPAMGPRDVQPGDEVYALSGCRGLAVLRKSSVNGLDCFKFVGLSFVDGWMYGRAVQRPTWETLLLT